MRRIAPALLVIALVPAGCGGPGKGAAPARTATAVAAPIRVAVAAPTHRPKANVPWPVRITVSDARGNPVRARLTMRILLAGQPVGKVDKGAVYRFTGSWREPKGKEITWPAAAREQPLTFQAVVTAKGTTVRKRWWIRVR